MTVLLFFVAYVTFNIWLGRWLYLDVLRRGRSWWWLVAVKFFAPIAVPLYLLTRHPRGRVR